MNNDDALLATHGETLSKVAADALAHGLQHNAAPIVSPAAFPDALRRPRATFVTLEQDGDLRGCIGSVAARRSLVEDIAANAFGAGFRDPRFPPLTESALARLSVTMSILGPIETVRCANEGELYERARIGVDGFVITAEGHRGLFLPQVWESLPTPRAFFEALKQKAGLPPDYWSPQLHIERFHVTSIPKRQVSDLLSA